MPIEELHPRYENRHVFFDGSAHEDYRESLAFLMPLPEEGLGVIGYTWVHAQGQDGQGRAGSMAVVYGPGVPEPVFDVADGILVPDDMGFDKWQVGPMRLTMPEGMNGLHMAFDGARVKLEYEFDPINPSFAYLPNPGGCESWLADDRAEQAGRVTGRLEVGDRRVAIDGYVHRDHSWGMRDWGGPQHWKWWNVMAPGISLHAMEIQAFGKTTLHGYVFREGTMSLLVGLDADYELDHRFMHTSVTATFRDETGRATHVRTSQAADLAWPVSTRLTLHEASMRAEIDGQEATGYIEMAWSPDYIAHHCRQDVDSMYAGKAALTIDR
ncbi:MAG TPA: hypothetical protein VGP90_14115 [Acidimicrobiia bacterium]|nr:hypothetical protein [Acidimicrobiia bacterium]